MLVLSRKINERVMIGENVEVEILEIRGNVVRIGIKAPREVSVVRQGEHQMFARESIKEACPVWISPAT